MGTSNLAQQNEEPSSARIVQVQVVDSLDSHLMGEMDLINKNVNLESIPLPPNPPPLPPNTILEQTIMKQKRLSRTRTTDLRKKILLKRTFELVCEIMDHENGFDEFSVDSPPEEAIEDDLKRNKKEDEGDNSDERTHAKNQHYSSDSSSDESSSDSDSDDESSNTSSSDSSSGSSDSNDDQDEEEEKQRRYRMKNKKRTKKMVKTTNKRRRNKDQTIPKFKNDYSQLPATYVMQSQCFNYSNQFSNNEAYEENHTSDMSSSIAPQVDDIEEMRPHFDDDIVDLNTSYDTDFVDTYENNHLNLNHQFGEQQHQYQLGTNDEQLVCLHLNSIDNTSNSHIKENNQDFYSSLKRHRTCGEDEDGENDYFKVKRTKYTLVN